MADASVRAPIPPILLQALDRIGFVPPADADKHLPLIPVDQTLPVELFEEKQLKQVRFYLRQLPPESCFGQVAWQFAAFFHLPAKILQEVTNQLNQSTAFAKAMALSQARPGPLSGLFLNWYQGKDLDETQTDVVAAQWRVDLYVSLDILGKMSRPAGTSPLLLDSDTPPAKRLLH